MALAGYSAYDSYGNLVFEEGTQPMMAYASLYKHDASDLYLATYRAYDPATARWLNRDPIREAGGLNLYVYVGGNPVVGFDPNGLFTLGIDFSSSSGAGYGGQATVSVVFGYSKECGFSMALQRTVSAGSYAGAGLNLGIGFTLT